MPDNLIQNRSNSIFIAVLAALVACEAVVLVSDLSNGVRYSVGGVVAAALVLVVFKLSQSRSESRSDH
jgi:uncharacterized membrane protein (DUF373 family)